MTAERVLVYAGRYYDSVTLMLASGEAESRTRGGVAAALMGTPFNIELLERQGFRFPTDVKPRSNDLVVAVRADDEEALAEAIAAIESRLAAPPPRSEIVGAPRLSLRAAVRADPGAESCLPFGSRQSRHL
jgi:FdrA protein